MNLKKNEIKILKLLISSSSYLSSYEIATLTQINRRSVRDEMANIKIILKSLGYELESKTSKGYMIKDLSSQSVNHLSQIIEKSERQRESLFPIIADEKEIFVVRLLIETDDYIKIDDLADQFLTSRSAISSALKLSKETLAKHDLSLKQKPNYGIRVIGDEINKRKVLCDYFFTNLDTSQMLYDFLNCFLTNKNSLEYGVIQIIKKHHIEMADIALCDFLLCLSIALNRINLDKTLTHSLDLTPIKGRDEFNAAKEIAEYLKENGNYNLNPYEIEQLAIQLICKRSTRGLKQKNDSKIKHLVKNILLKIKENTLIEFDDSEFYKALFLYIDSAMIRDFYNEKIRTPLYDKIKDAYPLAYELAEITSSILNEYTKKSLSASELTSFTIFYNSAIQQQKDEKKNALLLCALGHSSEVLHKSILSRRFGDALNIDATSQYYKLSTEDIKKYDFVITTIPVHSSFPIPYVNISQNITDEDLDKIENFLYSLFNKDKTELLFHPKLYIDSVIVNDKKSIANEFYKLIKKQYPKVKTTIKNNIISQNKSQLIAYNNGLAIIKLNKPINNNNILSVLLLDKAFLWNKQKIQLIILFSCSDSKNYIYNTISNKMMNLSHNKKAVNSLLKNPSYPLFLKILRKN